MVVVLVCFRLAMPPTHDVGECWCETVFSPRKHTDIAVQWDPNLGPGVWPTLRQQRLSQHLEFGVQDTETLEPNEYMYIYICTCIHIYIDIHITHAIMSVCLYVCIYIYIHIYRYM